MKPDFSRWKYALICTLTVCVFFCALLLSFVRVSLSQVDRFREPLNAVLSRWLGQPVVLGKLWGHMAGLNPVLYVRSLAVYAHNNSVPQVRFDGVALELDLGRSLWRVMPIFRALRINTVEAKLHPAINAFQQPSVHIEKEGWGAMDLLAYLQQQRVLSVGAMKIQSGLGPKAMRLSFQPLHYAHSNGQYFLQMAFSLNGGAPMRLLIAPGHGSESGRAEGYVEIPAQNLLPLVRFFPLGSALSALQSAGKWWFMMPTGRKKGRLQGTLQVSALRVKLGHTRTEIEDFKTHLTGVFDSQSWHLDLWDTNLNWQHKNWPFAHLVASYSMPYYAFFVDRITLDPSRGQSLWSAPWVPEKTRVILQKLAPAGTLKCLALEVPEKNPADFYLTAAVHDAEVKSYAGTPTAKHVDGTLFMRADRGAFRIAADQLELGLTQVFAHPWRWRQVQGILHWFVAKERLELWSSPLSLQAELGKLRGAFHLRVPFDARPSRLSLLLGVRSGNLASYMDYLPVHNLDTSLVRWFKNAKIDGALPEGVFLFNGDIGAQSSEDPLYDMYYRLKAARVLYDRNWPRMRQLDASVFADNQSVRIEGTRAMSFASTDFSAISVRVFPLNENSAPTLTAKAHINSTGVDFKSLLASSPLKAQLPKTADGWSFSKGDLVADLNLSTPLHAESTNTVQIMLKTQGLDFAMPESHIDMRNIRGSLRYDNRQGFALSQLRGEMFGEEANFVVYSQPQKSRFKTLIEAVGTADSRGLYWLRALPDSVIHGPIDYHAWLTLSDKTPAHLRITSNLRNTHLALPILSLPSDPKKARPLQLDIILSKLMQLRFSLAGQLFGQLVLNGTELKRGSLSFNQGLPPLAPTNGLAIYGNVKRLDIKAVHEWISQFVPLQKNPTVRVGPYQSPRHIAQIPNQRKKKLRLGNPPQRAPQSWYAKIPIVLHNFSVGALTYGDTFSISKARLSARLRLSGSAQVALQSPELDFRLSIPKNTAPWQLVVNHIVLDKGQGSSERKGRSALQAIQRNPALTLDKLRLPAVKVVIKTLRLWGKKLRDVSFLLRSDSKGLELAQLEAGMRHLECKGAVSWHKEQGKSYTQVHLSMFSDALSEALKTLGFQSRILAAQTRVDTDLRWAGAPWSYASNNLIGTLDIKLNDGTIKDVGSATEPLRLFSLFNFTAIMRRLSLDFSDIFGRGLAFESATATLKFDQGLVSTITPVRITSSASDFELRGQFDYKRNRVRSCLVVSLPLTQNLPFLAVLLGAPQLGGAIFLVDQLLGDKAMQFAKIQYQITGKLDSPKILPAKTQGNQQSPICQIAS